MTASVLEACAWPASRAGEALLALAKRARLEPATVDRTPSLDAQGASDLARLGMFIEAASATLGIEAEPTEAAYPQAGALVRGAGPALVALPNDAEGEIRLIAVIAGGGSTVHLLAPDLAEHRAPAELLRSAICAPIEAGPAAAVDAPLNAAAVPPKRRADARAALLRERLSVARVGGVWALRLAPSAKVGSEIRYAGLHRRAIALVAARAVEIFLGVFAWWLLGKGALSGRLDRGYLIAWGLVLITQVPFRALAAWAQGRLALDAGAAIKRRLLAGALSLSPEEVRRDGAGALLGRVIESDAVESLSLRAGFEGLTAVLSLAASGALLGLGAGGALSVLALLLAVALVLAVGAAHLRRFRLWTEARVAMTHDLVERMVGHRTRLAQEDPSRWHDGEDEALERSITVSRAMDDAVVALSATPRAFLVIGAAALAPAFLSGEATTASLAVGLGATLLAFRALRGLTGGVASLVGAKVAWEKVKPILDAGGRAEPGADPIIALTHRVPPEGALIEARGLTFRYSDRGRSVLSGLSLRVAQGDRLLLEGGSGGGKSTLGAIMAGLRVPESGLLLLGGLDRRTLGGAGFRRFVVAAPQFHENHVFSATFAFNLLMGRGYPPQPEDLAEAVTICEELDLGGLLSRMPGGLEQIVGETGWQLSHGERSRLYIARALLQRAELIVLDESFAALDPTTLERALRCVLKRAKAVLVIAHP